MQLDHYKICFCNDLLEFITKESYFGEKNPDKSISDIYKRKKIMNDLNSVIYMKFFMYIICKNINYKLQCLCFFTSYKINYKTKFLCSSNLKN